VNTSIHPNFTGDVYTFVFSTKITVTVITDGVNSFVTTINDQGKWQIAILRDDISFSFEELVTELIRIEEMYISIVH
jgi:hypothetical protein